MKLVLHIDRLVLRGIPEGDRDAFVNALETGLSLELARPDVVSGWMNSGHQAGLRARLNAASDPVALGQSCAHAIANGTMR